MLLKRVSYPRRYGDMIHRFAKPVPVLSMVTNQMIDYVYNVHGNRVLNWNREVLSPVNLQTYVDAVTATGVPLPNCFGFIDGSVRPISRPGEHQRPLYNGNKRVHALKFQSIALPNGLIGNLFGPVGKLQNSTGHHLYSRDVTGGRPKCMTPNVNFCRLYTYFKKGKRFDKN